MKRTIPKSLVQRQEKIRQKTLEVVTQAILALESQGYNIKIKDLVSVTGLSRSVLPSRMFKGAGRVWYHPAADY